MRSLFDLEEASIILSALSEMDDFFLPKSVSRKDLYTLASKFIQAMDLKMKEDGEMPIPNLFLDKFDSTKFVEIDLTQVEMDYVLCALYVMVPEGAGYPANINSVSSRIYNKISALFINGVIDHPGNDVIEMIIQYKESPDVHSEGGLKTHKNPSN